MTRRPLLTVAVLLALATSACGGVDTEAVTLRGDLTDVSGWTVPAAPVLEPALSVPGRPFLPSTSDDVRPTVLRDDETAVLVGAGALTAWSSVDGEQTWRRSFADGVCAADGPDDGAVAVLSGADGRFGPCTRVTLVDAGTGEVAWRRDLDSAADVTSADLTLGDDVLLVSGECGEVLRLDATSGRPRPTVAPADRGCDHEPAFGDDEVVVREDPLRGPGPDAVLRALDADTGGGTWRRPMRGDSTGLDGLAATEPLVLDVTEAGHRALRLYDGTGRPGPYVGQRLSSTSGASVRARSGDVLVVSYDRPGTYAYDLGTGEELWRVLPTATGERTVAGADAEGRLVWLRTVEVARDDGGWTTQWQVLRSPADDPEALELLGALPETTAGLVPGPDGVSVSGDEIVLALADAAEVVALPDTAVGPAPEVVTTRTTRLTALGDDDLRPADVLDVCDAVDPASLAPLGFSRGLPAPADCRWIELADPELVERELSVRAEASVPAEGRTAVEVADERLRELRTTYDGPDGWRQVSGLGDDALARSSGQASGDVSSVDLLVRDANVVLVVEIDVEAAVAETFPAARPLDLVERTALEVATDVLGSLDRAVDLPAPPEGTDPGPVLPDVCSVADGVSAQVVAPGTRGRDLSPDLPAAAARLSRCAWSSTTGGQERTLVVTAYTVGPGVLPLATGATASAEAVARQLGAIGRPWPPGGGDAVLWTYRGDDYESRLLTLRREELLVTVDAAVDGAPVPDDLARAALRVARRVLNATPR